MLALVVEEDPPRSVELDDVTRLEEVLTVELLPITLLDVDCEVVLSDEGELWLV